MAAFSQAERQPVWPLLMLGATLVVWSGAFVAIRELLVELTPGAIMLLRFLLASVGYVGVLAWRAATGKAIRWPQRSAWPLLLAFGLFGVVGYHAGVNFGEQTVSAGVAAVIVALSPAITAAIVYAARLEPVRPAAAFGIALSLAGVAMVSLLRPGATMAVSSLVGPAIVLMAPASWALATLSVKRLARTMDPVDITAIGTWIGTAMMLPLVPRTFLGQSAALSAKGWALIAYLAAGATVFGYLAWNVAVARYRATNVASSVYLIPPMTILIAWVVLGEPVNVWFVVGTAAIIGGVALVERARQQGVLG